MSDDTLVAEWDMSPPAGVVEAVVTAAVVAVEEEAEEAVVAAVEAVATVVEMEVEAAVASEGEVRSDEFTIRVESELSRCRYSISVETDRLRQFSTVSDWANRTR